MKLIVTINSENVDWIISVGKILSIGRIATYLKIVSQQPNMIVAQIDNSDFFSEFCFTNIHESQDGKGSRRAFHQLFTSTSTLFADT